MPNLCLFHLPLQQKNEVVSEYNLIFIKEMKRYFFSFSFILSVLFISGKM